LEQFAKLRVPGFSESVCKLSLCKAPLLRALSHALFTARGQRDFPAPPVVPARSYLNQSLPFQRQNVPAERRAVHRQFGRQPIDRYWAHGLQPGEELILGRSETDGSQKLIVELRKVTGSLPDGQAGTLFGLGGGLERQNRLHCNGGFYTKYVRIRLCQAVGNFTFPLPTILPVGSRGLVPESPLPPMIFCFLSLP
jgi:hypothetical protein